MKLSTIAGSSVTPHPNMSQPVAASGQLLEDTSDATVTVEAGMYALTMTVSAGLGIFKAGWATTATAANVVFVATNGETILIEVPTGTIHFHYILTGTNAKAFLRKLQA